MSHSTKSGIRASHEEGMYTRRTILRGADNYGPWKAKMKTVLNADDCWQTVCGREICPSEVFPVFNAAGVPTNKSERDVAANVADLEILRAAFAKRLP